VTRLAQAWRALDREQRRAALAALGLVAAMFLPWYSKTDTFVERGAAKAAQTSSNAFQAFSFVEAAVLLVSAGVLALLFARAERRRFELPGGDGLSVMIAGGWTAVLIFYRLLDKPGVHGNQRITATVGVQWGIFIALLVALGLLFAGAGMRAAAQPPPVSMPGQPRPRGGRGERAQASERREAPAKRATSVLPAGRPQTPASAALGERSATRPRPRYPPAPGEQMSLEDRPPRPADR
jgi:hypothetical protein